MKKVLSLILAVSILLSVFSISVSATENIETAPMEKVKIELEPCFGDYEIIPSEVDMLAVNKDIHESNNSFANATFRTPKLNDSNPQKFEITVGGTIHRETWLFGLIQRKVDEDYYRFEIQGEATVRITLDDIPLYCDYEMELWHFKNEKFVTMEDIEMVDYSYKVGVTPEEIVRTLPAGTYYIRVYSYNETYNDAESYSLLVKGQYTYQNMSVNDLQNSGAVAAIWLSDFNPCGINPFTTKSEVTIGYRNHAIFNEEDAFANPYYEHLLTNNRIEQASIYFWGVNTRKAVADAIKAMSEVTERELKNNEKVKLRIDRTTAGAEIAYQLFTTNIATELLILNYLMGGTPSAIMNMLFPMEEWIADKEDFLWYLRYLYNGINPGSSETDVVRITVSYIIETAYDSSQIQYFIADYTPQDIVLGSLYTKDEIYAISEYSYTYGKIYAAYNFNDIEEIINY